MSSYATPRQFGTFKDPLKICLGVCLLALAVIFGVIACGGDDVAGGDGTLCTTDTDCPLGTVCSANGNCVESDCEWCQDGQICYRTAENPEGTCSAPECYDETDCGGDPCIAGQCNGPYGGSECTDDSDCDEGESCNPFSNTCVEDDNGGDNNNNGTGDLCDGVECGEGQVCDPDTGNCVNEGTDPCEGVTCTGGQVCDPSTGTCVDNTGECLQECDPATPGTCGGDTPYCVDGCCSECIGGADCPGSQLCIDGFCTEPSGCTTEADCPTGYDCIGGQCEPPATGQECSDNDDCPDGTMCNPDTMTCEELGGEFCGGCDPGCTCPGDLVCDGFFCTGCEITFTDLTGGCPSGQLCLEGLCFPFG